jgi:hypothetical protein
MFTPKADSAAEGNHRAAIKVVPLADNLDVLQQQLKILRRRQKLLKGTGPLIAR